MGKSTISCHWYFVGKKRPPGCTVSGRSALRFEQRAVGRWRGEHGVSVAGAFVQGRADAYDAIGCCNCRLSHSQPQYCQPRINKPGFISLGGILPIVMIWYLHGTFPIKQPRGLLFNLGSTLWAILIWICLAELKSKYSLNTGLVWMGYRNVHSIFYLAFECYSYTKYQLFYDMSRFMIGICYNQQ